MALAGSSERVAVAGTGGTGAWASAPSSGRSCGSAIGLFAGSCRAYACSVVPIMPVAVCPSVGLTGNRPRREPPPSAQRHDRRRSAHIPALVTTTTAPTRKGHTGSPVSVGPGCRRGPWVPCAVTDTVNDQDPDTTWPSAEVTRIVHGKATAGFQRRSPTPTVAPCNLRWARRPHVAVRADHRHGGEPGRVFAERRGDPGPDLRSVAPSAGSLVVNGVRPGGRRRGEGHQTISSTATSSRRVGRPSSAPEDAEAGPSGRRRCRRAVR